MSQLLDKGSPASQVDPERVLGTSVASLRDALERELGLTEGAPESAEDVAPTPEALASLHGGEALASLSAETRGELVERFVRRFERAARQRVSELSGDGLLYASEVSEALSDERELQREAFAEVLAALRADREPPPRREGFSAATDYAWAMTRYVFTERNGWLGWTLLVGSLLAGFAAALGVLKISQWSLGEQGGSSLRRSLRSTVRKLPGPLYVLFAAGGLMLGLHAVWLPSFVDAPLNIALQALLFLAVFWVGWRFTGAITERVGDWATPDGESPGEQVLEIARKLLRLGLILLFLFVGVELIFGTDLTALVAGLGIVGLAVTLAAQDTLKDLFAAVTLHVNRPFVRGDKVRLAGHFGWIEDIGFRMTRLRTLDGHLVTIPNAKLVADVVENVDARPHIRRRFHIDLPFDTPVDQISRAVEVVRDVIREAGDLDEEREVEVHFDEIGEHSLKLLVQYYFGEGDYWKAKAKDTEIDLALVQRFREEGLDFAFPTQTLHVLRDEPAEESDGSDEDS
ncbi:MAG: hypothetical protein DHS20C15_20000 [Planctomycetota bacterium]|nr:MAG: hypothetical protein DHS20C15_20000 [Planctomycetota bacterium]